MDKRSELLRYLTAQEKTVPNRELQAVLNVSRRTVINYINEINSYGKDLILSSSQGYTCVDYSGARKLLSEFEAMQSFDSFEKRCSYLFKKLLLSSSHPTLDELADEIFISPATLNNELSRLRGVLREHGLYLKTKNNRLFIIGEERDKRKFVMELLNQELEQSHFNLQTMRSMFQKADIVKIEQIVRQVLKAHSCFLDDFSCLNYVLHLAICIEAALSAPVCPDTDDFHQEVCSVSPHLTTIVNEIYTRLKDEYHVDFSFEQILDASALMGTRLVSVDLGSLHFDQLKDVIPGEVQELLMDIIASVHSVYGIDLKTDSFMVRFAFHLKNLLERARRGILIPKNNLITIKDDFPFLFVIAEYIASIIGGRIHMRLSENEVSYIALHLGVLMEEKNSFSHKVNCVLVMYDYYNMGITIFEKLKQMTDNLYPAGIVSSYEQLDEIEEVDLVLTTLPDKPELNIPIISIHMIPTEQDYEKIISQTNTLAQNLSSRELSRQIRLLFRREIFFSPTSFSSREEAIDFLCTKMEQLGYVDSQFRREVYYHEEVASTAMQNIALPHPLASDETHTRVSAIAVALNQKPIAWSDNQVDFIFLLSLRGEDRPLFKDIFSVLSAFLQAPENISQLKNCTDFDTFVHLLIRQENSSISS